MFAAIVDIYRRTSKPRDIFWNRFVARPLAAVVLAPLAKTPVTPNQVTLATVGVFLAAALTWVFCPGRTGAIAGAVILEVAYVLDCVDGQLARLKRISSPVGAHLDFLIDELKAFLLVAAVSLRCARFEGSNDPWLVEGLLGLVAVASAISLTTFQRRPEYAQATGAAVKQGTGDYGQGFAAEAPRRRSPLQLVESFGQLLAHYPSYVLFVAIADRLGWFLHVYVVIHAAYAARAFLIISLKLGRFIRRPIDVLPASSNEPPDAPTL